MSLRKLSYYAAGLIPVLVSIFAFPVILIARQNKVIGQLYYWIIFAVSEYLCLSRADHEVRKLLFQQMHEDLAGKKESSGEMKVLEIGPGTGGNFAFYPKLVNLTTLELNPLLKKHASAIRSMYPDINIESSIIGNAEDMSSIKDGSFDAVVGTHILCCIRDPEAAVKEIHRVLKPGGKFYTLEYVFFPEDECHKRLLQRLYAPFWRFFGMGCKAGSQDCKSCLEKQGFDTSNISEYRHPDLIITHSLTEYGTAIKHVNDVTQEPIVIIDGNDAAKSDNDMPIAGG